MTILDLLKSSKWRIFNVEVAKAIGLNECLVLMELADVDNYFKTINPKNEWFYLTYDEISDRTTLSVYAIRKAIHSLKKQKILDTRTKGAPAKQFFILNDEKLTEALHGIGRTRPIELDTTRHIELDTTRPVESGRSLIPIQEHINKEHNFDLSIFNEYEKAILETWIKYRKEIKKPMTQSAINLFKKEFTNRGVPDVKAAIETSILNGYQGYKFNLKEEPKFKPKY